jgi:hypothetical protein
MKKIYLFSIILIISSNVFSQRDMKPGYIITNSGDTAFGLIDYQLDVYNAENCYFIKNNEASSVTYKPGQIKAYRIIDGKYYVSQKVKIENSEREVFLEFLVDGKVDIFYAPPNYYFIEKEDNGIHILENTEKTVVVDEKKYSKENKEYIGILLAYMIDDPALYSKIQSLKLDQKSLINIATEYHNQVCPGEPCTLYSKSNLKNIYKIGYAIGCNLNKVYMVINETDYNATSSAPGIITGLEFNYYTKGVDDRFSFTLGLYYSQVQQKLVLSDNHYDHLDVEFLSKNILINTYFSYTYPKYKIKPFVGLGVFYFNTLKNSKNLSRFISYEPKKQACGPVFVGGINFHLNKTYSFKFETNYQYGYICESEDYAYPSSTDNFNFMLSMQYTFN